MKMKKVCLYVRVSTQTQTTENQIQALKEVAERSGYEIVKIYSDDGISGSKGREDKGRRGNSNHLQKTKNPQL